MTPIENQGLSQMVTSIKAAQEDLDNILFALRKLEWAEPIEEAAQNMEVHLYRAWLQGRVLLGETD